MKHNYQLLHLRKVQFSFAPILTCNIVTRGRSLEKVGENTKKFLNSQATQKKHRVKKKNSCKLLADQSVKNQIVNNTIDNKIKLKVENPLTPFAFLMVRP